MARDERDLRDTGRTEAFSDGIFAVAITLLAIDLKPPHLQENTGNVSLLKALFALWPSYVAFAISFLTILIMWVNHHTILDHVAGVDRYFMLLNGLLLLFVSAVPFPTALVADYLTTPAAKAVCAVYAGTFMLINMTYNLLWRRVVYDQRLLKEDITQERARSVTYALLRGFPMYLVATIASVFNGYAGLGICALLWFYWAFFAYERKG